MKQLYLRAISRLVFLFALALALSAFASPTAAYGTTTCFSDCEAAFQSCYHVCKGLPPPPEGCFSLCNDPFLECVGNC